MTIDEFVQVFPDGEIHIARTRPSYDFVKEKPPPLQWTVQLNLGPHYGNPFRGDDLEALLDQVCEARLNTLGEEAKSRARDQRTLESKAAELRERIESVRKKNP